MVNLFLSSLSRVPYAFVLCWEIRFLSHVKVTQKQDFLSDLFRAKTFAMCFYDSMN